MRLNSRQLFVSAAVAAMLVAVPAIAQAGDHRGGEGPPAEVASDGNRVGEGGKGDVTALGETFDDFVSIFNPSGTGETRLNLAGSGGNDSFWRVLNNADANNRFEIRQGFPGTPRMVIRQGGNVGLGVDNPLSPLHIDRLGGFQLRLQGSGADYRMDAFGTSLRIGHTTNTNQFRIFGAEAPFNALVVRDGIGIGTESPQARLHVRDGAANVLVAGEDGIGVGTPSPSADFHVTNLTGGPNTNIRFDNGPERWANAVNQAGNFVFNKIGTAASEVVYRDFDHPTATLHIRGPVGASQFKVLPLPSSAEAQRMRARGENPREGIDLLEQIRDLEARVAELEAKLGE